MDPELVESIIDSNMESVIESKKFRFALRAIGISLVPELVDPELVDPELVDPELVESMIESIIESMIESLMESIIESIIESIVESIIELRNLLFRVFLQGCIFLFCICVETLPH